MAATGTVDRRIDEFYDDAMIVDPTEIDPSSSARDLLNFAGRLNNLSNNVKGLVLHVIIIGVRGMGGRGKSMLALAICSDVGVRDAARLFCFWAFGIPNVEDNENLVKQVRAEVMGSPPRGEPCPVWASAKQKLSNANCICDHHKEGILDRLEASIDVLDDQARRCFAFWTWGIFQRVEKSLWMHCCTFGCTSDNALIVLLERRSRVWTIIGLAIRS